MKALVIFILPAMMLIGCGKMNSNTETAETVLTNLSDANHISASDVNSVNEGLLDETVEVTETGANSMLLKVGGAELLIDFIEDLKGDKPEEVAMIINGVEVATSIASDSSALQALIASLVTSQLEDVDIMGIPAHELVKVGLSLIKGDAEKADFSNLFGTLVRGFLGNYLSKNPIGAIFAPILDGVLGGISGDVNSNPDNVNNNNPGQGGIGSIVGTIGGALAGGNPMLGGLFSLITNLIK